MSDIKVGDLVVIVKPSPCCKSIKSIGRILKVLDRQPKYYGICPTCKEIVKMDKNMVAIGEDLFCPKERLKKIEPLSDHDTIKTIKELENVE